MTTHAVRQAGPWLADLHRARADAALAIAKRQRWTQLAWGAFVLVSLLNAFLVKDLGPAGLSGLAGLMWTVNAVLAILNTVGLGRALDAHLDRPVDWAGRAGAVLARAGGHAGERSRHLGRGECGPGGARIIDSSAG